MQNDCKTVLFEVSGLTSDQYRIIITKLNQILALLKPDFTSEDNAVKVMTASLESAKGRLPHNQTTKGT